MNIENKIYELYFMIFNESPNSDTLKSLLKVFLENDNSLDHLENYLRTSEKFKNLSKKLEIELEISILYYSLLNRKPDVDGVIFFRDQILKHNKSLDWVKKNITDSDEYKSMI